MLQTGFLEKIKTHFIFNNFFSKIVSFMSYVEIYIKAEQATGEKYNNGTCALYAE